MSHATQTAMLHDCRGAFADTLIALAREDDRIVAVCNDSVGSSNLTTFKAEFPDRMINVGIAEQDLVGVGAGLANGGKPPCGAGGEIRYEAEEERSNQRSEADRGSVKRCVLPQDQ